MSVHHEKVSKDKQGFIESVFDWFLDDCSSCLRWWSGAQLALHFGEGQFS